MRVTITLVSIVGVCLGVWYFRIKGNRPMVAVVPATQSAVGGSPATGLASDEDTQFFQRNANERMAHVRVRWWGEVVGQRVGQDGRIEHVKDYLKTEPAAFNFFVQAGPDTLAIAQDAGGRRATLYLKNLRLREGRIEADVVGVGTNFGLRGPMTRAGGGQSATRIGTMEAPMPQVFQAGKPVRGRMSSTGYSRGDGPMGAGYHIQTGQHYEIELVEVLPLSQVMQDQASFDNDVPAAVEEEARRDMKRPEKEPGTTVR